MRHRDATLLLLTAFTLIPAGRLASAGPERLTLEYRPGTAEDREFRQLDVYPPRHGEKNAPVFIFVHGGAWVKGDKEHYRGIGERFARQGVLAILPNYRLSPAVRHPVHAQDVAAAVAWVFAHAAEYGGDPKRIFLAGHSAGGHLVALIACAPQFLAAHHLRPADLAGVVAISGIYDIARMSADGIHADEHLQSIFGNDPANWKNASPLFLINPVISEFPALPKLLLAWAGRDPLFIVKNGEALRDTLAANRHRTEVVTIDGANHSTIVWFLGNPGQPLSDAVYRFMDHRPPGG